MLLTEEGGRVMKYFVTGFGGPGFSTPEEARLVLKDMILPGFEVLMKLEKKGKILAGGLPVGERSFVFIAEASTNEELDQMLRSIPFWGVLEWEVIPLQTFAGRASMERAFLDKMKRR
jgi:hypothetical protein